MFTITLIVTGLFLTIAATIIQPVGYRLFFSGVFLNTNLSLKLIPLERQ